MVLALAACERAPTEPSSALTEAEAAELADAIACGFSVGDVALTLDGGLTLEASLARVAGEPAGVQSVSLVGSFDGSTADGREGACEVDMHASFDPETRTRTVTGDVCGRPVSIRRAWRFGP